MEDLTRLSDQLEAAAAGLARIQQVLVVAETTSTQDTARRMCGGMPGLAVFAGRQTAGRGRLGRAWADTSHLGVAMTFVLDAGDIGEGRLAIGAGLAACLTVQAATNAPVGLRWPNDVVAGAKDGGPGRKVAGVLIERHERLALVGIGINVLHRPNDWDPELGRRATSLAELGSHWDRVEVAARLMCDLDRVLVLPEVELAAEWTARDLLVGRPCAFMHDGHRYDGIVRRVAPTSHIELETAAGLVRLPALTTSMVHEA